MLTCQVGGNDQAMWHFGPIGVLFTYASRGFLGSHAWRGLQSMKCFFRPDELHLASQNMPMSEAQRASVQLRNPTCNDFHQLLHSNGGANMRVSRHPCGHGLRQRPPGLIIPIISANSSISVAGGDPEVYGQGKRGRQQSWPRQLDNSGGEANASIIALADKRQRR